jgi:hypothetical protein
MESLRQCGLEIEPRRITVHPPHEVPSLRYYRTLLCSICLERRGY